MENVIKDLAIICSVKQTPLTTEMSALSTRLHGVILLQTNVLIQALSYKNSLDHTYFPESHAVTVPVIVAKLQKLKTCRNLA